ncbi:MAG: pantetheine-phosphate adenylyltransferase [Oscillospiraceae bacterium]|nr:pantetheine-phosphate adenylyltransferase [Oscillospiraceae bacterium]
MKIGIYPGSFDPVTKGHLDIISRAEKLFDKLIVAVMVNPDKQSTFSASERVEMLRRATSSLPNVEIDSFDGLLAEYAKIYHATAIVKGLRALSDFEYEFQMALTNRKLNADLETIFLSTNAENMFLSSSMVKQVARFGGDISPFVPSCIAKDIQQRLLQEREAKRESNQ